MPAEAFIQCRVTPEMKTLVRALAEREQITESALVKELLQVVLRTASVRGSSFFVSLTKARPVFKSTSAHFSRLQVRR